ncbi:MAG TPA: polysaccharide deacetylase family protein [Acidobacteriota bacterium]|nr:polysaccharide deacetylase family protein [Acidobacteriota bacterium]
MPDRSKQPTLALTIDVEGFAESHAESVRVPADLLETGRSDTEIAANLDATLALLERFGCRATFFFLGRIGRTAPHLVRRVADAGHEIGCHSLWHLRLAAFSPGELRAALREARSLLEDASGTRVVGFRAPEFSIREANRWAFDTLVETGFRYDSSVVPTGLHDVYGMNGIPQAIFRWPNGLIEFPLPVVRLFGLDIPVGGGGYFRLYPVSWTLRTLRRRSRQGRPTAFYVHPYEIGPSAPRLPGLPPWRRLRHYIRLGDGGRRLTVLLRSLKFAPMADVLAAAGFPVDEDGA